MSTEALLADVLREPRADAPRRAFAEALLAGGDPRGELITLQLADGDPRRIDQLVEQHGVAWLGSLRAIAKRAQFHRGFVTRLELLEGIKPTAEHVTDPALATVEELLPGTAHHDVYARFITSPAMTSLRRIAVYNDQLVTALAKSPAPITHVAWHADARESGERWLERMLRVLERRSEITSLSCKLWMVRLVQQSPLFERLTSIMISKRVNESVRQWPLGGRCIPMTIQSTVMEPCVAGPWEWLGAIEVAPQGDDAVVRAWGEWGLHHITGALQHLPSSVRRVEIEGDVRDHARLVSTAALFKLDLAVTRPRPRLGYVRARAIRPARQP